MGSASRYMELRLYRITPSAVHSKISTDNGQRYSSWSSGTLLSITLCRTKMGLYENGFQCLAISQKNGQRAFLPRELPVCIRRIHLSSISGNRLAVELSTPAHFVPSVQFKSRCLILTYSGPRVRASYSM